MITSKKDWKSFFQLEKQLLTLISDQKILAGDKNNLSYISVPYKNSVLERPPKFIHAIISLQDNAELINKIESDIQELKVRYTALSNKSTFPSRFPNLLEPLPLQINLSKNLAYRSHMISQVEGDGFIQIKRFDLDDQSGQADLDAEALRADGIEAQVIDNAFSKVLNVSINDLIRFANKEFSATKLTVRTSSGMQYLARIRFPDSFQAVRVSYGLLIVKSDVVVVESLPQALRIHRLETTKEKVILPIDCDAEIFIKES